MSTRWIHTVLLVVLVFAHGPATVLSVQAAHPAAPARAETHLPLVMGGQLTEAASPQTESPAEETADADADLADLSEVGSTPLSHDDVSAGTVTNCANDTDFSAKLVGGGTVNFNCGTATIVLASTKVIAQNTVIDGGGTITLSGGQARRHFQVNGGATLTLRNLTLVDGFANHDGGAIFAAGNSTLVLENVTLRNNRTTLTYSGGAIVSYGAVTIRNSRFEGNSGGSGGAFYNRWPGASATIEDTVFSDNRALSEGVYNGLGGAILVWDGAQVTLRNSRLENNRAQRGGAIYNTFGGAASMLIIERSRLTGNRAAHGGGAIFNEADVRLFDVEIDNNEAGFFGAGVYNLGGDLRGSFVRVRDNRILDLQDDAYGGGVYNEERYISPTVSARGRVLLESSTLTGNTAKVGGGIFSDDNTDVRLTQVTIHGHSTEEAGGIYAGGALTIENSTLSNNSAAAGGGAIYVNGGTLDMRFSTLAGNSNPALRFPGDLRAAANLYTLAGNIVAGTCSESIGSAGHNLETGTSCGFTQATDKQNSNPQLGTLADNGGPTLTHLPQAGSPAINAGGTSCPATDQRGFQRPAAGACDMGAVEAAAPPLTVTPFPSPTPQPPGGATPEPPVTPQPPVTPPPIVHSRLPNGIAPTITVSPQSGRAGDTVRVSGRSPAGFSQVRVVSMLDGQTIGSVLVNAASGGNYSLQFIIPAGTRPGPIELCATVPGSNRAQFNCVPFTINAPPAGSVVGSLPAGVTARGAQLQLSDGTGRVVHSAPINNSTGAFSLANVAPGVYRYNVVGALSSPVTGGVGRIDPASPFSPNLNVNITCGVRTLATTGSVSATPSRSSMVSRQMALDTLGALRTLNVLGGAGAPVFDRNSRPIGLYVSGVETNVTFEAMPQASGTVQRVFIEFVNPDGTRVGNRIQLNAPPWRTTFNVGRLAPSRGTRHSAIKVTPVVNGREECPYYVDIEVIANPFQAAGVQPNALVWDTAAGVYKIQGIVPHIPGVLPTEFRLPPPPVDVKFFGTFHNRFNAGIQVVGTLNLEGMAHIQAIRTVNYAYVMNRELIPPNWQITLLRPNARLPITDLRELSFPFGPHPLVPDYNIDLPFVEIPVISFFGLIDVTVDAGAGLGASVTVSGYVKPLKPEVSATLRPTARAYAELGVGIRLLAGLAKAGASARVDAEFSAPLTVTLNRTPDVDLDACLQFRFSVRAYVSALWGAAKKDTTKEVARWGGCVSDLSIAEADARFQTEPTVPDLLAAPVIAVAANGTQVNAYVDSTAAAGAPLNSRIMVRMRSGSNATWSAPLALSNANHSADAPVVTFVGPEQWPLVAWAEKRLTYQQAQQFGDNLNAILRRQEIVYRLYRNGQWEPAVNLTTDLLGDGLPALAGGTGGAVLAWVRDTDGNWLTRRDQRIAVTTFDIASRTFAPFTLLSGAGPGLNGDVQVAWDATNQRAYVVWVYDADGDLKTANDRRLSLAFRDQVSWVLLNPQPLPPRVDSPTIAVGPEGLRIAFLVREPAADGQVGLVGTNGVLWTARFQNGLWSAAPVLDAGNRPVFAEEPVLATNGNESLLLFRRFGAANDTSRFGQLAVSRIVGTNPAARPLYLTDEPQQNWQASLAINPLNGQALITRVTRPALVGASVAELDALARIAATEAVAAVEVEDMILTAAADPVSIISYPQTADPALDPLRVSSKAPAPGATLWITATVRNLGRSRADGTRVRLYAGTPGNGMLLQTSAVLPNLAFNAAATTTFAVTASGGRESFYAEILPGGPDAGTGNNLAQVVVGELSAPVVAGVFESAAWVDGLDVLWANPAGEFVLGYRILRGTQPSGPFDLMGESTITGFTDVPVPRNRQFCYVIESYNANTVSPRSAPVCGRLAPLAIYLPTMLQR